MERVLVVSTVIKSVGYDEKTQTLEIEFQSGAIYLHYDVPLEIYNGLMNAESKGRYFGQNIRDNFQSDKVLPARGFEELDP